MSSPSTPKLEGATSWIIQQVIPLEILGRIPLSSKQIHAFPHFLRIICVFAGNAVSTVKKFWSRRGKPGIQIVYYQVSLLSLRVRI